LILMSACTLFAVSGQAQGEEANMANAKKMMTKGGTAFAMLPPQTSKPAPTLLLFSATVEESLTTEPYCRVGRLLHAQGWNVVSLDLPCHGADRRAGEPTELAGWAARIAKGEDIVAAFQKRVNDVVAHLVASGVADPARIAVAGTSRGGFLAFQAAAGNPHIRAVAAFAPVTDLIALREFAGQDKNPLVQRLALVNTVDKLADRASWITIGDHDKRVGTDKAVAFAEALKQAAKKKKLEARVDLQVVPVPGHASLPEWHDQAAGWFQEILGTTVRVLPDAGNPLAVPCMVYPAAGKAGQKPGLIIHLYGHGGSHTDFNLRRPSYDRLRQALREAGYMIVVPDLGPSHWMNARAVATLDAVIAGLTKSGEVDARRVHLLGTSMGAGSALIYAGRRSDSVRSVCAIFPMTDLAAWTTERPVWLGPIAQAQGLAPAQAATALRDLSPLQHAADLAKLPVFLLHGEADTVVPVHHSRDLAAALRTAGGRVVYHEVPGGGHDDGIAANWQEALLRHILDADAHKQATQHSQGK
jgi:alpha-beta hydrolase superfamily lysophospholipase